LRDVVGAYSDKIKNTEDDDVERSEREEAWLSSVENPQLSGELRDIFNNTDFLSEVRTSLSVTAETEDRFGLKVIELGEAGEADYAENVARDAEATVPEAYMHIASDGRRTLVIRSSQLESIKKSIADPENLDDNEQHEVAYVRHEYVHSQKSILLGKDHETGLAMEELRAERLSGNKGGYGNIKDLMNFVNISAHFDWYEATELSAKNPESSTAEFMSRLANGVDLETMTNLMVMTQPSYEGFDESINTEVVEHISKKYGVERYKEFIVSSVKRFKEIGASYSGIISGINKNKALGQIIKEVEEAQAS
jgi:hypothetical protein